MTGVEDELGDSFRDIWNKCGNDVGKFISHVAITLKNETNFLNDKDYIVILKKYFDEVMNATNATKATDENNLNISTTNDDQIQPNNEAMINNQSFTVNDHSTNDSFGHVLVPATQYNPSEFSGDENTSGNLIVDETANNDDDDNDSVIPETQYEPDEISIDSHSRASSTHSLVCATEKHVKFAVDIQIHSDSVAKLDSMNESGCGSKAGNKDDEGDELIQVNQETNSSWATGPIDASQAIISHLDSELLTNDDSNAFRNDRLTDSISMSSTFVDNESKMDAEAPNVVVTESNRKNDMSATDRLDEPDGNTSATSYLTCHEAERSTSSTPELENFRTPMVAEPSSAALRTSFDARSSTPDFSASKFTQASIAIDERSITPDIFAANVSQARNLSNAPSVVDERSATGESSAAEEPHTKEAAIVSSVIDTSVVEMNDDSYSNDNELFGACTQVFPPAQPLQFNNKNQAANTSASDLNQAESDDNEKANDDAAITNDDKLMENDQHQPNEILVDENEDSYDMYAAQTQMYPVESINVTNEISDGIVPSTGSSEMRPPMRSNESRKSSLFKKRRVTPSKDQSSEKDLFAAATQEFLPLSKPQPAERFKKDHQSPAASSTDAIYNMETQLLPSTNGNAKQKRKSYASTDSQDIWPPSTPCQSVVARISVKDLEKNDRSSKKPKALLSKKWLFESQQDSDGDAEELNSRSPPNKKSKTSSEKRKADKVETVTSSSTKKNESKQSTIEGSVSSAEIARIQKRRVSIVLERLKFDVNSNVSSASENDEKSSETPKRSERQKKHSKDGVNTSDGDRKSRETEMKTRSNKKTDRTVSDVTPNRATRASVRSKAADVSVSFDVPKTRRSARNETHGAAHNDSRSESSSTSRSSSRNSSRKVAALEDASSFDLPLARLRRDNSRSNTRSSCAVRSRTNAHNVLIDANPRIMFTKVNMDRDDLKKAMQSVPKMGGEIVDCPTKCTVLVCERVFRTNKMMSSIGRGIPIVTPEWLIASRKAKQFIDTDSYQLQDAENEKRFNFNLRSSLEIARKRPLFDEYLVYTTPNIVPPPNEIAMIVECGGGVYSNNYRKEFPSKFKKIVVSSTADAQLWNKIRIHHPGISIINTEGLMRNVMQQKIDFNGYKLCK